MCGKYMEILRDMQGFLKKNKRHSLFLVMIKK